MSKCEYWWRVCLVDLKVTWWLSLGVCSPACLLFSPQPFTAVHQLPVTTVTKPFKTGDSEGHTFILTQPWQPEVWLCSLRGLQGKAFSSSSSARNLPSVLELSTFNGHLFFVHRFSSVDLSQRNVIRFRSYLHNPRQFHFWDPYTNHSCKNSPLPQRRPHSQILGHGYTFSEGWSNFFFCCYT